MKRAQAIIESIVVTQSYDYEGVGFLCTFCHDYDQFAQLPAGVMFEGRSFGKTGWNSDRCVAYYRTDRKFAIPA